MEATVETIKNEGTFVSQQNVSIEDSKVNLGNIVYYHSDSVPSFSEIDFENEEFYPQPIFTESISRLLIQKRILIVKGNYHFDLLRFGKQLAQKVLETDVDLVVSELIQNENNETLLPQLAKQKKRSIVLLGNVHPKHIDYNIEGINSNSGGEAILLHNLY